MSEDSLNRLCVATSALANCAWPLLHHDLQTLSRAVTMFGIPISGWETDRECVASWIEQLRRMSMTGKRDGLTGGLPYLEAISRDEVRSVLDDLRQTKEHFRLFRTWYKETIAVANELPPECVGDDQLPRSQRWTKRLRIAIQDVPWPGNEADGDWTSLVFYGALMKSADKTQQRFADYAASLIPFVKEIRAMIPMIPSKTPPEGDNGKQSPAKESLSPSRLQARAVYEWGINEIEGAGMMTIPQLFDTIRDKLDLEATKASGEESKKLGDLLDSMPPNAETFGRYLRAAGIKRYDGAGNKLPGRSIRRANQI